MLSRRLAFAANPKHISGWSCGQPLFWTKIEMDFKFCFGLLKRGIILRRCWV